MILPYPNITGKNSTEQMIQLRSYLFRIVEQLNTELGDFESVGQQTRPVNTSFMNERLNIQSGEMYIKQAPCNISLKTVTIQTMYALDTGETPQCQSFLIFGISGTLPIIGVLAIDKNRTLRWNGQSEVTFETNEEGNVIATLPEERYSPLMILSANIFNIIQ